ncbi:MAG: pilus assembly protein [Chloroflexota bacterium]|nr:pilus assembly protein [Chloroflexota bacterium]
MRERGQSLVEFALVMPIFLVILLGTFEGVRAVLAYNTLSNASREGARYALVHGANATSPVGPGNTTALTTYVRKYTDTLGSSHVTITPTWPDGSNAIGSHAQVSITYAYAPLFGGWLHMGAVNISSTSKVVIAN